MSIVHTPHKFERECEKIILRKLSVMVRGPHNSEKLFIREDLNDHIGTTRSGFERVHEDFRYKGEEILNFDIAYNFMKAQRDASQMFKNKVIAEGA
jgi:hypothetical protein